MKILPNGIAVIEGDTHHAVWIEQCGKLVHDEWFAGEICKHIKPGDVVIDGGANIGTLTRAMLDAGAFVVAFEPNDDAVECLLFNCPELRKYGGGNWDRVGLSDRDESLHLRRLENSGASFMDGSPGTVQCVKYDGLRLSYDPTLIKLDCEGYEVKALRGARETIARCKPVLIVEVNKVALERAGDSDDALFALIESYGYRWRILQDNCKRGDPQYDIEAIWNT